MWRFLRNFRRNPIAASKLLCVALILSFYLIYIAFHTPTAATRKYPKPQRTRIQLERWKNGTGKADQLRRERVRKAMHHTFWGYRKKAWGFDDIMPVSGNVYNSRNGWGAFIVDTSTTLALMQMWEELRLSVDFILDDIDFDNPDGLVDPFETTIRYLGALVSLIELADAKIIPVTVISAEKREKLLKKAEYLGRRLLPAYESPSGLPWPRVDFATHSGSPDPPLVYELDPTKTRYKNPAIGPARAGSNILENCVLTVLTGNAEYCAKATGAWAHLVWNRWFVDAPGLVDGPIDIFTTEPVGRQKHWDAGHDSYYEYLIKASMLLPHSPNAKWYSKRWIQAAEALHSNLSSRAAVSSKYYMSHLYMGKIDGPWFMNEQSHLACFAPGNLLLGGRLLKRNDMIILGQALLEGCRHSYETTATGIGPETWSWKPAPEYRNGTFHPKTARQEAEFQKHGFWVADPQYRLRPEYVESLFYAWRITGEKRYREWAWQAFEAIERHCKTPNGFAGLNDVMAKPEKDVAQWKDESESFWGAETLKYLWLAFEDVGVGSLDDWIYSTEGHLFRRPQ
jgi:mannosyl-oligosaccharide alpha-1,2-mannosidase